MTPLAGYDPTSFPPFAVTVDVVVFTIRDSKLMVTLVTRGGPPHKGSLALPGGFVKIDETLERAAARELKEETGLASPATHLEQFRTYGDPGRDPRMRVVSVGFWAIVPDLPQPEGGTDAAAAGLFPVEEALTRHDLAFDHQRILEDALEHARSALETRTVATAFVESDFTISELRNVYETVWGVNLDQGNFQKKTTEIPGFIVATGERRDGGRGRPPELFRKGPARILDPPIRRPVHAAGRRGG